MRTLPHGKSQKPKAKTNTQFLVLVPARFWPSACPTIMQNHCAVVHGSLEFKSYTQYRVQRTASGENPGKPSGRQAYLGSVIRSVS